MTEDQIEFYRDGYDECHSVVLGTIKEQAAKLHDQQQIQVLRKLYAVIRDFNDPKKNALQEPPGPSAELDELARRRGYNEGQKILEESNYRVETMKRDFLDVFKTKSLSLESIALMDFVFNKLDLLDSRITRLQDDCEWDDL